MHVAILGEGRLGRSLTALLPAAGHTVTLRSGRGLPPPADVVVLAVADSAVAEVAARLPPGPPVLHCAGALGLDVLAPHTERGSLHPLMTFPGPSVGLPALAGIPAAVAGTPDALRLAAQLATDLGMVPFEVPGARALYHAAAVLAGNFPLVLLCDAAELLVAAGVAPEAASRVLIPLASASLRNAEHGLGALTGPVARGDTATLRSHLEAMAAHGLLEVGAVYEALVKHTLHRLGRPDGDDSGAT